MFYISTLGTKSVMQFLTRKFGDTKGDKSIPFLERFHRTIHDTDNAISFLRPENNA